MDSVSSRGFVGGTAIQIISHPAREWQEKSVRNLLDTNVALIFGECGQVNQIFLELL